MKIQKYKDELKELKDDLKKEEDEEERVEYAKRDLKSVEWEDNEFARPMEEKNWFFIIFYMINTNWRKWRIFF